jgi:hypothetical protein
MNTNNKGLGEAFLGSQVDLGNVVMVNGEAFSKGTDQYKNTPPPLPESTPFTEEQMAIVRIHDTPETMTKIDYVLSGSMPPPEDLTIEGILDLKKCILASRVGQPQKHYINGRLVGTPPPAPALGSRYIKGVWYGPYTLKSYWDSLKSSCVKSWKPLTKAQKVTFLVLAIPTVIAASPIIIVGGFFMTLLALGMVFMAVDKVGQGISWVNGLSSNPIKRGW